MEKHIFLNTFLKSLILMNLVYTCFARDFFNENANKTYRKYDNSITLHIIKSPYGINWQKRPINVILDLVKNKYFFPYTKRTLGHVTVELNCLNPQGLRNRIITGQGAESLEDLSNALISRRAGFSLINRPSTNPHLPLITTKGRLEDHGTLIPEFNKYLSKDSHNMAFLTYKITSKQCHKMMNFYKRYKKTTEETKNTKTPLAGNIYGFGAEPTLFQGAGCATYAEAFFEIAGILEYFNFYQKVYATSSLIKDTSLYSLIIADEKINEELKNKTLFTFPDPDLIYDYVYEINKKPNNFKGILEYGKFGKSAKYAIIGTSGL